MGFDGSLDNCTQYFFYDKTTVSIIKLDDPSYSKEILNDIEELDEENVLKKDINPDPKAKLFKSI
jgi:hypothetical protein